MKKTYVLLSSIIFFLILNGLSAKNGENQPQRNPFARALDLSEEQQTKISEMQVQLHRDITPLKGELDKLRADMKLVLTADEFDAGKLKKLNSEITNLQGDIKLKHLMHQRALRDLLTDVQKQKFDLHILSEKKARGNMRAQRVRNQARVKKLPSSQPMKKPAN